jgi:hypothetical protein
MGEEEKVEERGHVFFRSKYIPDMGPLAFGDSFLLQGKGQHPGTDRRKFDQLPRWDRDASPLIPESGWKRGYPARDWNWERRSGHWTGDMFYPRFVPRAVDITTTLLFRKAK